MKVFCIGSINIDHFYDCGHVVLPGESIPTLNYQRKIGGKGLNQAFALFKAGVSDVKYHGILGEDGAWMLAELSKLHNFPIEGIEVTKEVQFFGHCVIQIHEGNKGGENAVILHYGANHCFTEQKIEEILKEAEEGDWLLVQGETNLLDYIICYAKSHKKMIVLFNPAPYPPNATKEEWSKDYPCDWLILNQTESDQILQRSQSSHPTAVQGDPKMLVEAIKEITGAKNIIHTRGAKGSYVLLEDGHFFHQPALRLSKDLMKDTTGAGDAFAGYFVASYLGYLGDSFAKNDVRMAIRVATHAAALSIQREGALDSIPEADSVINSINMDRSV